MDETRSVGAIVHMIPDDEPVANKEATAYLDVQDAQLMERASSARVTIKGQGVNTTKKMKLDKTLATATLTFPRAGQYDMTFAVTNGSRVATFHHAQRVSGIAGVEVMTNRPVWAEALLIVCGVSMVLLGIAAFRHRHEIARHSSFK